MNANPTSSADTFAWGDICDIDGKPYEVGDRFVWAYGSSFGPSTIIAIERPVDDNTEGRYYSCHANDPGDYGDGEHYKLRELTRRVGGRASVADVKRLLSAIWNEHGEMEWLTRAMAAVAAEQ